MNQALDDLAARANLEHRQCLDIESQLNDLEALALGHAIEVGLALMAAGSAVPEGAWTKWCQDNLDFGITITHRYIRLAFYKDEIEAWVTGGGSGVIRDALYHLRGSPAVTGIRAPWQKSRRDEAVQWRQNGLTYKQIAETMSVHVSTVKMWLNPSYEANRKRRINEAARKRTAKRLELRRQEMQAAKWQQAEEMRSARPNVKEAYSLVRRALKHVDLAMAGDMDRIQRDDLRAAIQHLQAAEKFVQSFNRRERCVA